MIRRILTIVAIGMSTGIYADYVPEKMPICFDGDSLKKYADYVAYQNVSGIGALMDAGRCITVRKGQHMRIPANHNREMAGGEYPAITFSTPKGGKTAWVLEVTVVEEDDGLNVDSGFTSRQRPMDAKRIVNKKEEHQRMISEYSRKIQKRIRRNWVRPTNTDSGLSAIVEVKLSSAGEVTGAKIVQTSGVSAFDGSVEEAVFNASPLPMPSDAEVRKRFRVLRFQFEPENP